MSYVSFYPGMQRFSYYLFHYRRIYGKFPLLEDYRGPVEGKLEMINVFSFREGAEALQWGETEYNASGVHRQPFDRHQWIIEQARSYSHWFDPDLYNQFEREFREFCTSHKVAVLDCRPSSNYNVYSSLDLEQEAILKNWTVETAADDDLNYI